MAATDRAVVKAELAPPEGEAAVVARVVVVVHEAVVSRGSVANWGTARWEALKADTMARVTARTVVGGLAEVGSAKDAKEAVAVVGVLPVLVAVPTAGLLEGRGPVAVVIAVDAVALVSRAEGAAAASVGATAADTRAVGAARTARVDAEEKETARAEAAGAAEEVAVGAAGAEVDEEEATAVRRVVMRSRRHQAAPRLRGSSCAGNGGPRQTTAGSSFRAGSRSWRRGMRRTRGPS